MRMPYSSYPLRIPRLPCSAQSIRNSWGVLLRQPYM